MKKILRRLLLFIPVALLGYVLLIWLLGDLGWVRCAITRMGEEGHLNSRVKDIRNYHNVDILFLGSSHCYRTFDTRFYNANGYTCFNLGSSNQTPIQTYILLSQYLDSINPKQPNRLSLKYTPTSCAMMGWRVPSTSFAILPSMERLRAWHSLSAI